MSNARYTGPAKSISDAMTSALVYLLHVATGMPMMFKYNVGAKANTLGALRRRGLVVEVTRWTGRVGIDRDMFRNGRANVLTFEGLRALTYHEDELVRELAVEQALRDTAQCYAMAVNTATDLEEDEARWQNVVDELMREYRIGLSVVGLTNERRVFIDAETARERALATQPVGNCTASMRHGKCAETHHCELSADHGGEHSYREALAAELRERTEPCGTSRSHPAAVELTTCVLALGHPGSCVYRQSAKPAARLEYNGSHAFRPGDGGRCSYGDCGCPPSSPNHAGWEPRGWSEEDEARVIRKGTVCNAGGRCVLPIDHAGAHSVRAADEQCGWLANPARRPDEKDVRCTLKRDHRGRNHSWAPADLAPSPTAVQRDAFRADRLHGAKLGKCPHGYATDGGIWQPAGHVSMPPSVA